MSLTSVLFVAYLIIGLLVGLVFHEFAHAWVAGRVGDPTPRQAGRMTLDPRPHVDPFGTLVLPGMLLLPVLFGSLTFLPFAYAKPQPLSPWTLSRRERDLVLISLAGPGANLMVVLVAGVLFRFAGEVGQFSLFLRAVLLVNAFRARRREGIVRARVQA